MKNVRSIMYCFLSVFFTGSMISSCKEGVDGKDGVDGVSGSIVTISSNCTWVIDGEDTGKQACPETVDDDELDIKIVDGTWWVNGKDTGIQATGPTGSQGPRGPEGPRGPGIGSVITIGENGNWYIDDNNTGVSALGSQIEIGPNGNWWIDGKDTNMSAVGTGNIIPEVPEIPKDGWKEVALPGDLPGLGEGYDLFLPRLWDGITAQSGFHSLDWKLPAWVTFELGASYELTKLKLWARDDPGSDDDQWHRGQPKEFEVYGSLDPNPNGSWDDSWTLLGHFEWLHPEGKIFTDESDRTEDDFALIKLGQEFEFDATNIPVRYIRLRFISNYRYPSDPEPELGPISIAEISIWGTPSSVSAPTWTEVTSSVLTNYAMPFAHKSTPIINQGSSWNYDVDGGWQYNAAGGANGVVFANQALTYDHTLTMSAWTADCACFPSTSIVNGKLYQTVTLDAGKYRFSAYVFAFWAVGSEISSTSYLLAASGSDLPDFTAVGSSLSHFEFPFHSGDTPVNSSPEPYTIDFTVTESGTVSMGFVGNFANAEIHFSKVELWKLN